ncbi:DUF4271 domain-containing protein [Elizabethkingia sp. JS20170427COW]|nr:DUF4271 domain-containing protein [Elizabethkingia sp. JS20170427COW]
MIRIVENHDWVIYSLTGVVLLYVLSSRILNKGISLIDFLKSTQEDTSNVFINWGLIGLTYVFVLSIFITRYIPVVPRLIAENIQIQGYTLSRFGFAFIGLSIWALLRSFLSFLFYSSSFNRERWKYFIFTLNKYYSLVIIFISCLIIVQYFYPIDRFVFFDLGLFVLFFLFVFKNFYLLFNINPAFPKEWYYKFLYICTLQILPTLVVWKFLFLGL